MRLWWEVDTAYDTIVYYGFGNVEVLWCVRYSLVQYCQARYSTMSVDEVVLSRNVSNRVVHSHGSHVASVYRNTCRADTRKRNFWVRTIVYNDLILKYTK